MVFKYDLMYNDLLLYGVLSWIHIFIHADEANILLLQILGCRSKVHAS